MRKTVLITGTSSGIGRATVHYFKDRDWNIIATMRDPKKNNSFEESDQLIATRLDVTDTSSISSAIKTGINHFGSIDVLINNAAYSLTGPFEGGTEEQIKELYEVDVFGVMNVIREILPHFRYQNKGTIINISSLGGRIGMPLSSFYTSAKWAVEGFSESIRYELEKFNIQVKIIEPGSVNTSFASNAVIVTREDITEYHSAMEKRIAAYQNRKGKQNSPEDIAKVIYQAANNNSSRLRFLAGRDAKIFWTIYKVLPFSIFTAILRKIAG